MAVFFWIDSSSECEDIKTASFQKEINTEKENASDVVDLKSPSDAALKRRLSVREKAAAFQEASVKDATY